MSKIAIILSSHGFFAKEALASVEMIMGSKIENIGVLSVTEGKDYETVLQEAKDLVHELNTENGLLILTDIFGGTPSNVATYLAIEDENIIVYSGFNLPVLLELMYAREMEKSQLQLKIEETYKIGLTCISDKIERNYENGNQVVSY